MKHFGVSLFLTLLTSIFYGQDQTVGLFINDNPSFNGYTLFNPNLSNTTYLIDNCGNQVHSWTSDYRPKNSVYLLENGNLLRTCRIANVPGVGGRLEILDWEGNITWYHNFSLDFELHHDIQPLPNGNILIISTEVFTLEEAMQEGRDPSISEFELKSEKIVEIQPVGTDEINVVWEWRAWDHLIQDYDEAMANYGVVADNPGLIDINYSASTGPNAKIDWLHFNSVSYNVQLDQIVITSRNLSEIYIIDHSTTTSEAAQHIGGLYGKGGDILYRYGNPMSYDRGSIVNRTLFFPHDAGWIESGFPDEGKMLVFNNQLSDDESEISMFSLPQDSAGFYTDPGNLAYGPDNFDWNYTSTSFYSSKISGARQLPNGNFLICAGTSGQFIEINKHGDELWHYINPVGNSGIVSQGEVPVTNAVFKIQRYAPDFPGFIEVELIPGLPVELNPWPSDCVILEDTLIEVSIKVYLEGPFEEAGMSESDDMLPLFQPYQPSPWNYPGTERLDLHPDQIVDWVLIEFRDADLPQNASSATMVDKQAVLLRSDGMIVGLDGISKPSFYNSFTHSLYVVVFHRNHLGVLSSLPLESDGSFFNYNFSTAAEKTYGGIDGCTQLQSGEWGLFSGDANGDTKIDEEDIKDFWRNLAGKAGYEGSDFNINFQVENEDKNELYIKNIGKMSLVPD